jgi:hypothetical protein
LYYQLIIQLNLILVYKARNMDEGTDRKKIEEYLKLYCIEEILDETINDIIERRPTNPYVEIAQLIEAKTMAEIIEVKIKPVLIGSGNVGVQAIVLTNLGPFTGECGYKYNSDNIAFIDYSGAELAIDEVLRLTDPKETNKIDELLISLSDMRPEIITAVSIACTRAGARHKGLPLYKYISTLSEIDPCIPLPVVSVLTRSVGGSNLHTVQDVSIASIDSSSLDTTIEHLTKVVSKIQNEALNGNFHVSASRHMGCLQLQNGSLKDALQVAIA